MLWTDPSQYPYESGALFLGHKDGLEVGSRLNATL